MNALRKIVILACTSLLVLFPSVAEDGGEGGWVNVPGGIGFAAPAASQPPMHTRYLQRYTQSVGEPLQLRLSKDLRGAIAFVRTNHGEHVALATRNGSFVVSSTVLRRLANHGVTEFEILFVANNRTGFVNVEINLGTGITTITVY